MVSVVKSAARTGLQLFKAHKNKGKSMVTYKGLIDLSCQGIKAVYEVPIKGQRSVHMSVSASQYMDNRSVVIVDSKRFLELWRSCPYPLHKDIATGSPATWKNDDKYNDAKEGFSHGEPNPVPLADINFDISYVSVFPWLPYLRRLERSIEHVYFTNGITRTIWLLCQEAPFFPVEVETDKAEDLAHWAGAPKFKPVTVESLFSCPIDRD